MSADRCQASTFTLSWWWG